MVSIRLSEEMDQKLAHLCSETKRSKSFYIKEALSLYFEDMEDYFVTLDRISAPKRKLYTSQEVQDMLDDA